MNNSIVIPESTTNFVKVGGKCYKYFGPAPPNTPVTNPAGFYGNCGCDDTLTCVKCVNCCFSDHSAMRFTMKGTGTSTYFDTNGSYGANMTVVIGSPLAGGGAVGQVDLGNPKRWLLTFEDSLAGNGIAAGGLYLSFIINLNGDCHGPGEGQYQAQWKWHNSSGTTLTQFDYVNSGSEAPMNDNCCGFGEVSLPYLFPAPSNLPYFSNAEGNGRYFYRSVGSGIDAIGSVTVRLELFNNYCCFNGAGCNSTGAKRCDGSCA
jgi:hypothetical protein